MKAARKQSTAARLAALEAEFAEFKLMLAAERIMRERAETEPEAMLRTDRLMAEVERRIYPWRIE